MSRSALYRLAIVIAIVGAFELLCGVGLISKLTMPPPHRMLVDLWTILRSGSLNAAIAKTLTNARIAFVLAMVVGVASGVVLHRLRLVREGLDPLFPTYYAIPVFAFYPLLIILFGLGEPPRHRDLARGLVRRPSGPRPRPARLHRRNVGFHEHGPALRPGSARAAPSSGRASPGSRPFEIGGRRRHQPINREPSKPTSPRCWRLIFGRATSSSWTIYPAKGPRARELIEAASVSLRNLLPYSPDLNLIENTSPSSRHSCEKPQPKTVDALWAAIGRLVDLTECANYFAAARYDAIWAEIALVSDSGA